MSAYRETLHKWASQFVPSGAVVSKVTIDYDDGYEPTFTDRPASLTVAIWYADPWGDTGNVLTMEQVTSIGALLTELFAIEEPDKHEFVQEFSAESPYCGAMVMRNGGGDTCGLLRDDEVHR